MNYVWRFQSVEKHQEHEHLEGIVSLRLVLEAKWRGASVEFRQSAIPEGSLTYTEKIIWWRRLRIMDPYRKLFVV